MVVIQVCYDVISIPNAQTPASNYRAADAAVLPYLGPLVGGGRLGDGLRRVLSCFPHYIPNYTAKDPEPCIFLLYCSANQEAIKQRKEKGQNGTSHGISDLLLAPSPFMHARWSRILDRAELATLRKLFLRRVLGVVALCSTPAGS